MPRHALLRGRTDGRRIALAPFLPLGDAASVAISTLRCGVIPLTFAYEAMPGIPALRHTNRSNVVVLTVNFVFITSGSWAFASTFAALQTKFAHDQEAKKWAVNWNNGLYFLAMILAFAISIAIGFLVWGPNGRGP